MHSGLAIAAAAAGFGWLLAAGAVYVRRRPAEPSVGPKTLDLGPEPPALANFLVNDFRVTAAAVSATLLDLAARNVVELEQHGPGVYFVRLRSAYEPSLTAYERRVLDLLEARAHDGVVPAADLTTGPAEDSSRWRRAFETEVVTDAKIRGLSRDALDGRVPPVLTVLAGAPAALVWALSDFPTGAVVVVGAIAILGWIRARHPQRETPAGLEAASRWLGVRAALADDEEFARQSPLTVELWTRHLAYGAALGVAGGAVRALPMGAESDASAWSAYGGRWRPVRVVYPRLWPPAWGADPLIALAAGLAIVLGSAAVLYVLGAPLFDAGPVAKLILLVPCAGVIVGVAVMIMGWSDWLSTVEVTGPILRLRTFGDEKSRRYYVAVDDGSSSSIRAWRVSPNRYAELEQGEMITTRLTRNLCCVRWIIPSSTEAGPG